MYIINISTQQAFPLGISALRTHICTLLYFMVKTQCRVALPVNLCKTVQRALYQALISSFHMTMLQYHTRDKAGTQPRLTRNPFLGLKALTDCFCSYWGSSIFQGGGILSQTESQDECYQSSALVSLSFAFCSWHLKPGFQACRQQNTFQALPFEVNFLFQAEFFHLLC